MNVISPDTFLPYLWQIVKNWWWLFVPFALWNPLLFHYWWSRVDKFLSGKSNVLLEIKLPREQLKPIRAMEEVMAGIHGAMVHPPDLWEKWVDGQVQLSVHFEIVAADGKTHFYVRTPTDYRDSVEASIYSQYPEAEISEVDDYVKYVPQSIPNKEWDMFGADYKMTKDDHYPIKTHKKFETEHEALEQKRVDPVASLLETMGKVKQDEQFWIQISAEPVSDVDLGHSLSKWLADGIVLRNKLAKRPDQQASRPIIQDMVTILATGKAPAVEEAPKDIMPPEMRLTPGEKDIVTAIEEKMSKPIFKCNIRFIYLGKRETWFKPNFRLAFAFFTQYATSNLNAIYPLGKTLTKIPNALFFRPMNLFKKRRHYLRCRKLFRNYVNRFGPFFPRPGGTFIMNTEELASLFHFPGEAVAAAPGAVRVEAKRGEAPSQLPV